MANMSTATGKMYLEREFYEQHKNLVNKWVKFYQESNHIGEWYGLTYLTIEEKTEDELIIEFAGIGRWSWEDTLEWMFASEDFESQYLEELDVLKEKEVNEFLTEENISTARELTKYEDTFESIAQYVIGYRITKALLTDIGDEFIEENILPIIRNHGLKHLYQTVSSPLYIEKWLGIDMGWFDDTLELLEYDYPDEMLN